MKNRPDFIFGSIVSNTACSDSTPKLNGPGHAAGSTIAGQAISRSRCRCSGMDGMCFRSSPAFGNLPCRKRNGSGSGNSAGCCRFLRTACWPRLNNTGSLANATICGLFTGGLYGGSGRIPVSFRGAYLSCSPENFREIIFGTVDG